VCTTVEFDIDPDGKDKKLLAFCPLSQSRACGYKKCMNIVYKIAIYENENGNVK
jgi:Na+-translocating ferredoxin:NAD+ oxidoreductase RNF subunit RnfB